jgi:hypothetical protein
MAQSDVDWSSVLLSAHLEPIRIGSHNRFVRAVAVWRGRICSAADDGLIHIWGRVAATGVAPCAVGEELVPEKTLDGQAGEVWALISWNGWLISAGVDSIVRVISCAIPAFAIFFQFNCNTSPTLVLKRSTLYLWFEIGQ